MLEHTTKGIVYGYFNYTKIDSKGNERGSICINVIKPKQHETATDIGWESTYYWTDFTDELWKYLKGTLIKQSELKFQLVQDYKDSNKFTSQLIAINDFVIKQ